MTKSDNTNDETKWWKLIDDPNGRHQVMIQSVATKWWNKFMTKMMTTSNEKAMKCDDTQIIHTKL